MQRLEEAIMKMWASKTFKDRRYLVQRWLRWCNHYGLMPNPSTVAPFIMSIPTIKIQGQFAYAKAMSGTFRHLGLERQDVLTLTSSLRAQGGAIPDEQATPMPKPVLERWLNQLTCPFLRLSAMICWKTASRWGEVALLTKEHFIRATPEEVIIDWSTLPKGRKRDPYTPSMYTVICGHWTREIYNLLQLVRTDHPFCPWTTEKLEKQFKETRSMEEYGRHSFKRGAVTHLIEVAEQQGIQLDPRLISVLLKHKLVCDLLSSSDLRYPSAGPGLARLLGTQNLTKLL
jgi:integrase